MIWEFRKTPLILPTLLMLASIITAIASITSNVRLMITFILCVVTNLVMTALTGCLMPRSRSDIMDPSRSLICFSGPNAIVLILESGAVYCAMAIILIIFYNLANELVLGIRYGVMQQLMNIIPTFTLVRAENI
ncbi:hypothetical protein MSAN_02101600 [Mycena sanguinolenta]|uniref:Uncharacterized protein n=1 Tax=Mycena sanguinolenta TaxID=230812 RepID=A0A8H6XGI4_9AGAR|nr:hypothetical protein MSAN_02101600 [Mycena sanguinolenta]